MAVGSADIHQAIVTVWNTYGLEWEFKKNWKILSNRDEFPALHDQEAGPEQPFPYAVFEILLGDTTSRMSGHSVSELHEIHDIPFNFRVHSRKLKGSGKTAKEIAAELTEKIMIRYGGHPTVSPKTLTLDNGSFLLVEYQTEFGAPTGDDEYRWMVSYIIRIDVPIAV